MRAAKSHILRSTGFCCLAASLFCLLHLMMFWTPVNLSAKTFDENEVKAVFLYNLSKFITWPERTSEDRSFIIGLLGVDPFNGYLQKTVAKERIKGMPVRLQHFRHQRDIEWSRLRVLFIDGGSPDEIVELTAIARRHGVLCVGNTKSFCRYGGMIGLLTEGGKIQIEINVQEVREAGLYVSAQVLKLARIIETTPGGRG